MRPKLADLPARFDAIVIGGGITGAGLLAELARTGADVLLLEQNDFASGTSSASSKLVHGGLRYLKEGHWRLTLESVRERNRLLRSRAGLVERQRFLMPLYRGMKPGRAIMRLGLAVYDLMGGQWSSRALSARQALAIQPHLRREGLIGGVAYDDARTDDAGLVLRLIVEAVQAGASALNYARVTEVLSAQNRVRGVAVEDRVSGVTREIEAGLVIDAAGAWASGLRGAPAGAPPLRPLRGSHLTFPLAKLPVDTAVSWLHPRDRRPIFVYPWEGVALYGTTDLDHGEADLASPSISPPESEYLLEGLAHQFPDLGLGLGDAIASYAGVRPVVAGGKADPSAESRESASWTSPGWIGITGGKLTTFRVTARQVLKLAAQQEPKLAPLPDAQPTTIVPNRWRARYGEVFAAGAAAEAVVGTPYVWEELRWAAQREAVVHLDDLLLRRTRIGLLLPQGGAALLERAAALCGETLGWDAAKQAQERARYQELWHARHAPVPS